MVTLNGQLLKDLFNDTTITVTEAEIVEDQSIDLLNTYKSSLTNLTGAAGSKTGTYTSAQRGAILTLAREVYATQYKNPADKSSGNLGPAGVGFSNQNRLLDFAEKIAAQLKVAISSGSPPVLVSNDPILT